MFPLLLLPALTTRPAYTVAGVAGTVPWPRSHPVAMGLGLIVGALAGMTAGAWMEARRRECALGAGMVTFWALTSAATLTGFTRQGTPCRRGPGKQDVDRHMQKVAGGKARA